MEQKRRFKRLKSEKLAKAVCSRGSKRSSTGGKTDENTFKKKWL